MNRCKLGLLALLSVAALASAQFSRPSNARISSMGGAFIVDDITDVFRYPVTMLDYKGQLQATFDAPILGIKSTDDMLTIGATANSGNKMSEYYGAAATLLTPIKYTNNGINIPHLLLGLDLGTIQLGGDVFVEYSRYSDNNDDVTTEDNYSAMLLHPGLIASGKLGLEGLDIKAKIGVGFPISNGEHTQTTTTGTTTIDKIATKKGFYLETGAEAEAAMIGLDWTLGFDYTAESFQFEQNDVTQNPQRNSLTSAYLGCEFSVLENATAAVQYQFGLYHQYDYSDPDGNDYNRPGSEFHSFDAGLEKSWDNPWKLDSFQFRSGMSYNINVPRLRRIAGESKRTEKNNASYTGFIPTVGFGLSKGFLQLDMTLDMGDWGGFFTGPEVGAVTATMKF